MFEQEITQIVLRFFVDKKTTMDVESIIEELPYSKVEVPFLTDRDKKMLKESISIIRPEYVACSFVKSIKDIETMREYIKYCLNFFDI